ncbi:uncharacterized protein LOC8269761 [Ricinus communis]|uniref:uncharacterized protein LOC8269761 n=1 Tax=Ricinus communis TaxID=3988 RepID=UPI00201AD0A2|nr:uncharacterized protein LOC8269761 [Ricinus communis]XP_015581712.2 uncharacterized protein LOC8269761 [Ricinus communis]XP_015581713.2 uncharacterized protein LOC8269761 [Ricinus communis]
MATCVRAGPPLRPSLHVSRKASKSQQQQQHGTMCRLPVRLKDNIPTTSLKLDANARVSSQYGVVMKQPQSARKYQQAAIVCLFGGKDKADKNKEPFSWSFEKVMENFKGQSVEDVLRKQIEKQEFYDGGSGRNPPRGGGGGGDDAGESEDEGLAGIMDETLQVVLATIGFIFLYIYIITGEELTRLAKDYIKYLLKGSKSVRLKRAMNKWKRLYQKLTETEVVDKFWLEKTIVNTPTAYDSPAKYRQIYKSLLQSNADK